MTVLNCYCKIISIYVFCAMIYWLSLLWTSINETVNEVCDGALNQESINVNGGLHHLITTL